MGFIGGLIAGIVTVVVVGGGSLLAYSVYVFMIRQH